MGALFSKPKVTPPARMPDPEDPRVLSAERRRRQAASGGSGRTSTIMSRGSSPGTAAYGNSLLGQS